MFLRLLFGIKRSVTSRFPHFGRRFLRKVLFEDDKVANRM